MSIVRIPPTLREEAGGEREVLVEGGTVREVLDDLAARFPALGSRILDNGGVARFVNVYVEGEDVRTRDGLDTPVGDASTVILLPAMAGGSVVTAASTVDRLAGCKPAHARVLSRPNTT